MPAAKDKGASRRRKWRALLALSTMITGMAEMISLAETPLYPSISEAEKTMAQPAFVSPIHYRPRVGSVGDTIPFFWKGQYHIFYLRAGVGPTLWEHIVSDDLIHWFELPSAILPDGAVDGPDGFGLGTGSVIEHEGTFHLYYTGANPKNKLGNEAVLHATSSDLIVWTKHPDDALYADDLTYKNNGTGFRDPFVFGNEEAKAFWMILCAFDAKTGKKLQGVAESTDLATWKQVPPLDYDPPAEGNSECPDLFKIDDTWYIIHSIWHPSLKTGATYVRFSKKIWGTYHPSPTSEIDTTILYAAKSMYDGKRRVITGWIRDLGGNKDDGEPQFGGDQCVPREIYAGPNGQLYFRPVPEALAQFPRVVLSSEKNPGLTALSSPMTTPDNYMFECKVRVAPGAEFTVGMRQTGENSGYRLIIRSDKQTAEIAGSNFIYARKVDLDFSKPVKIQAFVQGTIIECFIDDEYAFSCRAYEHPTGKLKMSVEHGNAKVSDVVVKTSSDL